MIDERLVRHPLGFYRARNIPSPEDLQSYYAGRYYQEENAIYRHEYPADEVAYFRLKTAQLAAQVADLRSSDATGSLLDVGCGEGFAMQWFVDNGWNVSGIDYSAAGMSAMNPAMLDCTQFGDVFELLATQIAAGQRYDVIWLKHVLEHVAEPLELLTTLRRLSKDESLLVITVPNDFSLLQEKLLETGAIDDRFWIALPDHLSYFDRDSLANVADHCGWTVRDILADFPIDIFLLHPGSNYRSDPTAGRSAHAARITMENLVGETGHHRANALYRAMASVGLGRSMTAFLQPRKD